MISIAIPDSLVAEERSLREKTSKIGVVARAAAIFRVEEIYIFHDKLHGSKRDAELIEMILKYMEAPQYLRRHFFKKHPLLTYAGVLPPLRTPHHKPKVPLESLKAGEVREAVAVRRGGRLYVHVGLDQLIPLEGVASEGERMTVVITSGPPALSCRRARREEISEYWGYTITFYESLKTLLRRATYDHLIFTAKEGSPIEDRWSQLYRILKKPGKILMIFGSPYRGLYEILSDEKSHPSEFNGVVLNMVPKQGVQTIRTEEAILICLGILNLLLHL